MNIAILSKKNFNDIAFLYDVLQKEYSKDMDVLFINKNHPSEVEELTKDLADFLDFRVQERYNPHREADAIITLYENKEYDFQVFTKELIEPDLKIELEEVL